MLSETKTNNRIDVIVCAEMSFDLWKANGNKLVITSFSFWNRIPPYVGEKEFALEFIVLIVYWDSMQVIEFS